MQILSDTSLLQYIHNHNQFDTLYCHVLIFSEYCIARVLDARKQLSRWPSGVGIRLERCLQGSLARFPAETYFFPFGFFVRFPSLQIGVALANEIKHNHSPVVVVVFLTSDTVHHTSHCIYNYSRSYSLS